MPWGDAPAAHTPAPGGAASPFLLSSILPAHHSPFGHRRGHQHGISQRGSVLEPQRDPRLGVEELAVPLWEPTPAALKSDKSKTEQNRGWGTSHLLFLPSPLPGD